MHFPFSWIILSNCEQTLPDNTKEFSHGSAKADSHERLAQSGHALWANTTGMRISALGLTALLGFQGPSLGRRILLEEGRSPTCDPANLLCYLSMLLPYTGGKRSALSSHVVRDFLLGPWHTLNSTCCLLKQVKHTAKVTAVTQREKKIICSLKLSAPSWGENLAEATYPSKINISSAGIAGCIADQQPERLAHSPLPCISGVIFFSFNVTEDCITLAALAC